MLRASADRILQRNYKWINLNPFEVLLLTTDATQDEVKDRYRKVMPRRRPPATAAPLPGKRSHVCRLGCVLALQLSALVHPDKSRDPRASAAFHGACARGAAVMAGAWLC